MGKNNLDIQTFQIYYDDDSQESLNESPASKSKSKKKIFDISTISKLTRKTKDNLSVIRTDTNEVSFKKNSQNTSTIIKGLLIGFGILILFIVIDYFIG